MAYRHHLAKQPITGADNVGDFARFLDVISLSHGSQLNTSAAARECSVNRKTVEGHILIVEDLLLGFTLPVFARRAQRQLVQHPKFYFADAGIFASLRPAGPLDAPESIGGAALEGLVAQHLRAYLAYGNTECDLHFWRTKAGLEVGAAGYRLQTADCRLQTTGYRLQAADRGFGLWEHLNPKP